MKIDLHLHSLISTLNGDAIKWLSNREVVKSLKKHNIQAASFTDHNIFDKNFYDQMNILCKRQDILLFPGIELNVNRLNGIRSNVLIIFSDKLSKQKLIKLENLTKTIDKKGISLKELNTIFNDFDTIIIPHVGKSDYMGIEDLQEIKYDAIEISNLKHHNYKKFIKSKIKTSIVAFSDTHKWNSYPNITKLHTKLDNPITNFTELKAELNKNKNYVYDIYGKHIER